MNGFRNFFGNRYGIDNLNITLMVVALAGVYAERSGVINLALEGIMIFGAFIGVLFVRLVQQWGWFDAAKAAGDWVSLQGFMLMTMAVAALLGAIFSLLLAFAAINLRADQTVGGTALNLLAPALVLFQHFGFNPFEVFQRDVEEVSGAAGGVKNA